MFEISLISRPKLNLLGTHYGVDLGNGKVLDPQQNGIQIISRQDFGKGHQVKIESKRLANLAEWLGIFSLIENFKYDLLDNNCEHASRLIVEKKKESKQVTFLFVGLLVFLLIYILNRKS